MAVKKRVCINKYSCILDFLSYQIPIDQHAQHACITYSEFIRRIVKYGESCEFGREVISLANLATTSCQAWNAKFNKLGFKVVFYIGTITRHVASPQFEYLL